MHMLTSHNGPPFSEDPLSEYRAELIASYAASYARAHARYLGTPTALNRAKAELAHAQLVSATLPPSGHRDEWKDRVNDRADEMEAIRDEIRGGL